MFRTFAIEGSDLLDPAKRRAFDRELSEFEAKIQAARDTTADPPRWALQIGSVTSNAIGPVQSVTFYVVKRARSFTGNPAMPVVENQETITEEDFERLTSAKPLPPRPDVAPRILK